MKTEQFPGRSRKVNSIAAFAAILVAGVLAAGCVGGERAAQSQSTREEAGNEAAEAAERKADRTAQEGEAVAADTSDGGDEARAGEVELRIGGKPGTEFTGTCGVGGEKQDVSGEVPRSFTYQLDGGELECEIMNKGSGALEVVLKSGNNRSVQRINGPGAVIKLTYSGSGVSSSTTSSSSGSVNQQSSSSVTSNSINQQSSSSIVSSSSSVNQQSSSQSSR